MTDETERFAAASAALWLQREHLETLLFKLVEEKLVITSGATRWLSRADAEVVSALEQLRGGELLRATEVESLTDCLGLPAGATLAELASAAPEPWGTLFDDHRTALRELAYEVAAVTAANRTLLEAGAAAVRETLDRITRDVRTYDSSGRAAGGVRGPILLDEHA